MKHIFIPFTISIFILGCGVMNNPKEDNEPIHVPQKITVEIPDILIKNDSNTSSLKKSTKQKQWYQ